MACVRADPELSALPTHLRAEMWNERREQLETEAASCASERRIVPTEGQMCR